jgi:hypothetical protein
MIDDEMEEFDPEDYISSLPPVPKPSFPEGSILAKEYARIDADPASRFNAIDTSRYQALPPSGKEAGKLEAWEEAVKRAQTLQEHAGLRLMNDELMQQYSVNAWRAFNSGLEDRNALFKQEAELEKVRVLQVNRKRMAAQKQVQIQIPPTNPPPFKKPQKSVSRLSKTQKSVSRDIFFGASTSQKKKLV